MQIRDIAVKMILPEQYQSYFNLYIIIFKDSSLSDEYFLKLTDKIYDVYSNLKLDEKYYKEQFSKRLYFKIYLKIQNFYNFSRFQSDHIMLAYI